MILNYRNIYVTEMYVKTIQLPFPVPDTSHITMCTMQEIVFLTLEHHGYQNYKYV